MMSPYSNIVLLATLLLSSLSASILASPTYGSNNTASYTPSISVPAASPTATFAVIPSNITTTYISSPTGVSNGTSVPGSNSSFTGKPLSPSTTPVPASAATSLREFAPSAPALPHIEPPTQVVRLQVTSSLRTQNGEPQGPSWRELPELQQHFPTLRAVMYQHPFLKLIVEALPPKPWPILVADVPLWRTTEDDDLPHGIGQVARAKMQFKTEGELVAYENPSQETIMEVFKLVNEKGAAMYRIEWNRLHLRALGRGPQPGPGWKDVLPGRIKGFLIIYIWNAPSAIEEHSRKLKLLSEAGHITFSTYSIQSPEFVSRL
ncbi:hypothetical protein VTL71DRAFT_1980 [Oculimacula yallundae]|uniref:Uncharacterized protein n=1 Tax=Oculimacula yallundae TaxID=86028 RepID=A0ABR4CCR9_9HELO